MLIGQQEITCNVKEITKNMERSYRTGTLYTTVINYTPEGVEALIEEYKKVYKATPASDEFKKLRAEYEAKGWDYVPAQLTRKVYKHAEGLIVVTDSLKKVKDIAELCLRPKCYKYTEENMTSTGYRNYKFYRTLESTPLIIVLWHVDTKTYDVYDELEKIEDYYEVRDNLKAEYYKSWLNGERKKMTNADLEKLNATLNADCHDVLGYPTLRALLEQGCHNDEEMFMDYMAGVIADLDELGQWDTEYSTSTFIRDDLGCSTYVATKAGKNKGRRVCYVGEYDRQREEVEVQMVDICTQFLAYATYFYYDIQPLEVHNALESDVYGDAEKLYYNGDTEFHVTPIYVEAETTEPMFRRVTDYYPVR